MGVVCADNRDPRLVLDSTICGMNGRCHLPEKQRLPNLRLVSFFLSTCPPLEDQWQRASIDIKAARKRMLIREDERGALLKRDSTLTELHTLEQKPVPGIGVVFPAPSFA